MKKLTRIMVCALAAVMTLTACGTGGTTSSTTQSKTAESNASQSAADKSESTADVSDTGIYNAVDTLPIVKEPVALKVFMSQSANIVDFETNECTKWIEEQTGIDLVFETAPADAVKEKINLKLSSGDYPDVFLGCAGNIDETRYGADEGILVDLTSYLDKMPELQKMIAENPNMKGEITATDGKIYLTPYFNDCYHCTLAGKMWVNTDQLKKLGMEAPTTTDEFYNVLKKFKEQNPNGVPLAGYLNGWNSDPISFISNAFTYRGLEKKGLRLNGDKIDSAVVTDDYRESLKFMRKLYEEGLFYEASFTMDVNQMKSLLMEPGEPVLFYPAGASVNMIDAATAQEVYSHYYPIAPLKGPADKQYASYIPTPAGAGSCITSACKEPEAAARLFDFLFKYESSLYVSMGMKDADWTEPDEGAKGLTGEPALYKRIRPYSQEPQNANWQDVGVIYSPSAWRFGMQTSADVDIFSVEGLENMLYKASKELYEPYIPTDFAPLPTLKFLTEESNEMQTINVELEKNVTDYAVQFITGKADINDDSAWKSYVDAMQNVGLQKVIDFNQKAYERQYK